MIRVLHGNILRPLIYAFSGLILMCAAQRAQAVNAVAWEAANSLVDTTNYTGLTPFYWFANFGNPNAVTGQPMDQFEARNMPSWIHLETRPACIGDADDCTTPDATIRTGFSFEEAVGGVSSNSTGGQPTFNMLTLPNGITGRSGEAIDPIPGPGTTAQMVFMRILPGAPNAFRMWVVTDNGSGANYHEQARMRVSLRNTTGPPGFGGDSEQVEAEAMPSGVRIGQTPEGHNGIADAWAFRLSDVGLHDVFTVRPTSLAGGVPGHFPAFAGIMIQPIPEPTSAILILLGAFGLLSARARLRR